MAYVARHFPEGERLVFIDSWNHWGQRSQIEPTSQFGTVVLDETSNAVRQGGYVARTRVGEPTLSEAVDLETIRALCNRIEGELPITPTKAGD